MSRVGFGQVHRDERLPFLAARVDLSESLKPWQVRRVALEGSGKPRDGPRLVRQSLFIDLTDAMKDPEAFQIGPRALNEALQDLSQGIPLLLKLEEPHELLEEHGILRGFLHRTLESGDALVGVTQTIDQDATHSVIGHRAHGRIARLLRFLGEHLAQIAPAIVGVVQTLQCLHRARGAGVEMEGFVVDLRRAAAIALLGLDEPRSLDQNSRAVTGIGGYRVGGALQCLFDGVPGFRRESARSRALRYVGLVPSSSIAAAYASRASRF